MKSYTLGSLFSGIGGIDLAFQSAGFDIVFQVEIDEYCNRVLARHWPGVPRFGDIRTIDGSILPYCDVLAGGFPCQDISLAGRGAGIRAGTRSGLWFEFARLIGDLRPRIVLLENVAAITARDGTIVLGDLAALGYDARWGTLRASDAGAPHQRERWFCVAYANGNEQHQRNSGMERALTSESAPEGWESKFARNSNLGDSKSLERFDLRRKSRGFLETRESGRKGPKSVMVGSGCEQIKPTQPRLGRNADGLSAGLDFTRWPALPGQPQHAWEPPRTTTDKTYRAQRLKALGNAVVPQVVYPLALAIKAWLEDQDRAVGSS